MILRQLQSQTSVVNGGATPTQVRCMQPAIGCGYCMELSAVGRNAGTSYLPVNEPVRLP